MKATVFYLRSQEHKVSLLPSLLRKHVYAGTAVAMHVFDESPPALGWEYVKLLQAAVHPKAGLKLTLGMVEDWGYRNYINVYKLNPVSYLAYKTFQNQTSLSPFFPAVAVRDRMFLAQAGAALALQDASSFTQAFREVGSGGLLLVDFDDEGSVVEKLTTVGETLRAEVLQEARAYLQLQRPENVDLTILAESLHVELGYLHSALTAQAFMFDYRKLQISASQKKLAFNRWTKIDFAVTNCSDKPLTELEIEIKGPVKKSPGRLRIPALLPGSQELVPVSLMPDAPGEFPIEVVLSLVDDRVFSGWLPSTMIWLECDS